MKRKILILILFMFLMCGCTANVDIKIDKNGVVHESTTITAYADNQYSVDDLNNLFRKYLPAYYYVGIADTQPDVKIDNVFYYNRTAKNINNGVQVNYSYNFGLSSYVRSSRLVKNGHLSTNVKVNEKDNTILINTNKGNLLAFGTYSKLDNVSVRITPEYKVKESNADVIQGNTYIWNFNRASNKNIYILLDKSVKKPVPDKKEENKKPETDEKESILDDNGPVVKFVNKHPVLISVLAIGLFLIIVIFVLKFTKK